MVRVLFIHVAVLAFFPIASMAVIVVR